MIEQHPFSDLLPRQAVTLRGRAMKLTANLHRAEDLVQTTMLKAWANRDSYRPESNLRAWLFTIMRNTFFSDLRNTRREIADVDGILAAALSEEPAQDHVIALKEVLSAMLLLPPAQSQPLILMGVLGFSQLEVAEACGCTVGTVKSRVSRARTALGAALLRGPSNPDGALPLLPQAAAGATSANEVAHNAKQSESRFQE